MADAALAPIDRPNESDELFLRKREYLNHMLKASAWMQKHIVGRIRAIENVAPWYKGTSKERPEKLLGQVLDTTKNFFCLRFDYYIDMILVYQQGEAPLDIIWEDKRCAEIFLAKAKKLLKNYENYRQAVHRLNGLWTLVKERENLIANNAEYQKTVRAQAHELLLAIERIGDQFAQLDAEMTGEAPSSEPITKQEINEATEEIKNQVIEEGGKTRRAVKAAAKKVIKASTEEAVSDYEKRGPKGRVRNRQFKDVVEKMRSFAADSNELPKDLRGKAPDKWIHHACRQVWEKSDDGYPTFTALYNYCKQNSDKVLSLAGL